MHLTKISYYMLTFISATFLTLACFLHFNNQMLMIDWLLSNIGVTQLSLTLIFDKQGLLLSSVVLFISANVINFSATYMLGDPFIQRFTILVLMFVMSMNLLIFIPNLIVVILGWDGLGIISFLLVAYYSNPKSLSAAMITALTNRIGDALILLSIAWLMNENHWTFNFLWSSSSDTAIMISITLAACTKSAQVPFSSWLPAAMAAPTPVSALVHSSTLVTAGVFLLIRFYPFLTKVPNFNIILTSMACMTMLMAGMAATVEPDLKKIIALSTLSQLGVMMGSIGIGLPQIALFHLMTHALFKALLFVCAGIIIHFNLHNQDLRTTGNLWKLPVTSSCFLIANMALCGTPFLAAFYSKDIILESTLQTPTSTTIIILFMLATAFTGLYTAKFLTSLLWAPSNFQTLHSFSEDPMFSSTPMTFLTTFAILGGSLMNWMIIQPIQLTPMPLYLKLIPLLVAFVGLWYGSNMVINAPQTLPSQNLTVFLRTMWCLTPLSSQNMLKSPLILSNHLLYTIDQGWQEILGGQGTFKMSSSSSKLMIPMQNNLITSQLMMSTFIIIFILMWK